MKRVSAHGPARQAALMGALGLAAAMGIGRFAFTPMLPLMQRHDGLSLAAGGRLAAANYVGYLLGAVLCFALGPRPSSAARLGLAAVAVSTLAMAFTGDFWAWWALRLIAGIASAFVLIGVSAWALAALATERRAAWSGWVFAGVGAGIVFAGLAALAIGAADLAPSLGWLVLGAAASVVALIAALAIADAARSASAAPAKPALPAFDVAAWRLILSYGVFGFGYIIPATFLPAASRALVGDPALFGWTWPVFGLAAAGSTVIAATALGHVPPRRVWALGQMIMAGGVALPAIATSLAAMIIAAVAVGGTFMVITMAGMQEARRVGGEAAPRLMAAMTASFAAGQWAGPLTVSGAGSAATAIAGPSLLAAAALFLAALALLPGDTGDRVVAPPLTRARGGPAP